MKGMIFTMVVFSLFSVGCLNINPSSQNEEVEQLIQISDESNQINNKTAQLDFSKFNEQTSLWLNSWKKIDANFEFNLFSQVWEKDLVIDWDNYEKNEYFKSFELTLKYTKDNKKAIDMYSAGTVLDETENKLYASFDVDRRVFVFDFSRNKKTEILFTGSYEVLQDCLWLNDNELAILGFVADDKYTPFVWLFDIESKKQKFYSYQESMDSYVEDYFFKKFPDIRKTEE